MKDRVRQCEHCQVVRVQTRHTATARTVCSVSPKCCREKTVFSMLRTNESVRDFIRGLERRSSLVRDDDSHGHVTLLAGEGRLL